MNNDQFSVFIRFWGISKNDYKISAVIAKTGLKDLGKCYELAAETLPFQVSVRKCLIADGKSILSTV
jgi:hypothetical protein